MKSWLFGIFTSASICLSWNTYASNGFICVTDQAAGFAFNKTERTWASATFRSDHKYLVARPTALDKSLSKTPITWTVKEVGKTAAEYICRYEFNEFGGIYCQGLFGVFQMNQKTNRFLASYMVGYVNDGLGDDASKEGLNTPLLQIGKCSPL